MNIGRAVPSFAIISLALIVSLRNGVDLQRFVPLDRAAARAQLGIDGFTVISVGVLDPRKAHDLTIAALPMLPDVKLLIAGIGPERKKLEALAASLGVTDRVKFLGPRSDIPRLMQAMDVLVVNSHQEPFALTVLEGLASGVAVLATAVGGTPEMIAHGKNGALVSPRENAALAESLITLLHEPELRARLGRDARQSAEAHFSTNRFLREIESFYSQLHHRRMQKITQPILDEKLVTD